MVRKNRLALWMGTGLVAASLTALPHLAWAGSSDSANISNAGYTEFRNDVSEIAAMRLDQPQNVDRAKAMLTRHSQTQLSRGFILQMGHVAMQSDRFQSGVHNAADKRGGKDRLIARLQSNPYAVTEIRGWKDASKAVAQAAAQDAAMMNTVSHRLNEVAYGRTQNEARFANEARANQGGITGATQAPRMKKPNEIMVRSLAAGAILTLETSARGKSAAAQVAANAQNDQCLRWAHLNFRQCLAAARDTSERAYCISQQGIGERSDCWTQVLAPAS